MSDDIKRAIFTGILIGLALFISYSLINWAWDHRTATTAEQISAHVEKYHQ